MPAHWTVAFENFRIGLIFMAVLKDMTIRDGTTGERLTGSLLWPIRPTSTARSCQADAQGLSRLDPAIRTHRPSVLSCTHRKPEGAMTSSGSLNAGIAHPQFTGPGFGQSARRSLRASAVASKGCNSLHHPPALGVDYSADPSPYGLTRN